MCKLRRFHDLQLTELYLANVNSKKNNSLKLVKFKLRKIFFANNMYE